MTRKEFDSLPVNGGVTFTEEYTEGFKWLKPHMAPSRVMDCSNGGVFIVDGVPMSYGEIDGVMHRNG